MTVRRYSSILMTLAFRCIKPIQLSCSYFLLPFWCQWFLLCKLQHLRPWWTLSYSQDPSCLIRLWLLEFLDPPNSVLHLQGCKEIFLSCIFPFSFWQQKITVYQKVFARTKAPPIPCIIPPDRSISFCIWVTILWNFSWANFTSQ